MKNEKIIIRNWIIEATGDRYDIYENLELKYYHAHTYSLKEALEYVAERI